MPSTAHSLHQAAALGDTAALKTLLSQKADPNAPDTKGWTPLHHAVAEGHLEVAKVLVAHGADPHRPNAEGQTALDLSELVGHDAVTAFLKNPLAALSPASPSATPMPTPSPLPPVTHAAVSAPKPAVHAKAPAPHAPAPASAAGPSRWRRLITRLGLFVLWLAVLGAAGVFTGKYLALRLAPRHKFPLLQHDALQKNMGKKTCGDFATQQDAQEYFVRQGGPQEDPMKLDTDRNGQACDHLP